LSRSAGELTEDEIETVKTIIGNPRQFDIPDWFLNRQKDVKTGKTMQLTANQVDTKYREDLERMKKIRFVFSTICFLSCMCCPATTPPLLSPIISLTISLHTHPFRRSYSFSLSCLTACTAVCVTSGASRCAVSTPRPPVAAVLASWRPRTPASKSLLRSSENRRADASICVYYWWDKDLIKKTFVTFFCFSLFVVISSAPNLVSCACLALGSTVSPRVTSQFTLRLTLQVLIAK
jgi:hypothetical protein